MTLLQFVFDAACLFVASEYFWLWFSPVFFLLFIATVPRLIRELLLWR